jgi:nitrogen fixation protein
MIASVTREVDALIRDLGLVVPPEDLESPSISRREEGDGNGGLVGAKESWKKVVRVGKSEAQKYEDFSSLLRGRIAQAEKVMVECRKVVMAVRRGEEVPALVKKGEERVD